MHSVFDPAGKPIYHAPHILQVLVWLADQGVRRVRLTDGDDTFDADFTRVLSPQTP